MTSKIKQMRKTLLMMVKSNNLFSLVLIKMYQIPLKKVTKIFISIVAQVIKPDRQMTASQMELKDQIKWKILHQSQPHHQNLDHQVFLWPLLLRDNRLSSLKPSQRTNLMRKRTMMTMNRKSLRMIKMMMMKVRIQQIAKKSKIWQMMGDELTLGEFDQPQHRPAHLRGQVTAPYNRVGEMVVSLKGNLY